MKITLMVFPEKYIQGKWAIRAQKWCDFIICFFLIQQNKRGQKVHETLMVFPKNIPGQGKWAILGPELQLQIHSKGFLKFCAQKEAKRHMKIIFQLSTVNGTER